jgi:hypothetical protein
MIPQISEEANLSHSTGLVRRAELACCKFGGPAIICAPTGHTEEHDKKQEFARKAQFWLDSPSHPSFFRRGLTCLPQYFHLWGLRVEQSRACFLHSPAERIQRRSGSP